MRTDLRACATALWQYARASLLHYARWMADARVPVSRAAGASRVSDRDVGSAGRAQGRGVRPRRVLRRDRRRAPAVSRLCTRFPPPLARDAGVDADTHAHPAGGAPALERVLTIVVRAAHAACAARARPGAALAGAVAVRAANGACGAAAEGPAALAAAAVGAGLGASRLFRLVLTPRGAAQYCRRAPAPAPARAACQPRNRAIVNIPALRLRSARCDQSLSSS